MKKKLLVITITFSTLFIISCVKETNINEEYTINGEIEGFEDGTVFYLRNLATDAVFDSAVVNNNRFKFTGHLASPPEQIWLNTRVNNEFIYTNLLIGNEDVKVKGNITDFPYSVSITGSESQNGSNELQNKTKVLDKERDSLTDKYFAYSEEERKTHLKEIWGRIAIIDSLNEKIQFDYIKENPDTYISVIYLNYIKKSLPKTTVREIYNAYTPEIKKSKYAKVIEVFLKESISKVGDKYHEFEGLNPNNETVMFSDLRRDYTLLDFTAAYCVPCIQSIDELTEIYNKHSKSLAIVSFSGDAKKETWLKSLERDNVTWNSLWDGKGRYSETSIKYGNNGFPTFVLIDPEGVIVEKWTGYGKGEVKKKIEKYL